MHPDRVARLLAVLGIYMLLAVLALRVVSLVNIAWQNRMGVFDSAPQPVVPSLGRYSMSADGTQVTFEKQIETNGDTRWFSMPLEGGPSAPTEPPETVMEPFLVRDDQVYLLAGEGYALVQTSPRDTRIGNYARASDGSALAFGAYRPGGTWGLYVLDATGAVDWLGDHERIGEMAWAPDNQHLAFIAVVKGAPQIFIARRDGQEQRQLTGDATRKGRPRWSPDGRLIAYIETTGRPLFTSTPTPANPPPHGPYQAEEPPPVVPKFAIAVVEVPAAGNQPGASAAGSAATEQQLLQARSFLQDEQDKLDMAWGMQDSGPVVVYALKLPEHPKTYHLYALDPDSGETRRVVPSQEITALECPATMPGSGTAALRITLANSALRPADLQVLVRAHTQRFPPTSKLNTNVVRSENVQVAPGASQTVDWTVAAQPGLFTHVSVLANPDTTFAMDEKRCVIRNTYDHRLTLLPNLPYLSLVGPVSLAGFLLCIPWLRKQKKWFLWVLYLALPVFIFAIVLIEAFLLRTRLS